MFEDIRKSYGLTRNELSVITGRTVNYILKAEQATFPSAPVALLDFYSRSAYGGSFRLSQPWEPHDTELMRADYRAFQRRKRRSWLETWEPLPYTGGLPFRRKWVKRNVQPDWNGSWETRGSYAGNGAVGAFDLQPRPLIYSSAYGISVGLCIPAAVVYRNDKDLTHAGAIVEAMLDLVEYVSSGEFQAERYGDENLLEETADIFRIAMEEGVKLNDRANGDTAAA